MLIDRHLGRHVLHGRHAVALDRRASAALASRGAFGAYTVFPHVAGRIDRFLTGEGDTFQVDTAPRGDHAAAAGSASGPGEGTVKRILPDSHTDFVFSVAGEEFGIVFCLLHHGDLRLHRAARPAARRCKEHDDFTRFAVAGLVLLFGFQSIINMGVNLQLMPAKGMTLPFISYGGSSLIAIAISMGMVLALTRQRPEKRAQDAASSDAAPRACRRSKPMAKGTILLAAGGTGGHLFPAEALAHELIARGWAVHLVTDDRAERFAGKFPGRRDPCRSPSATIGSKNPIALAQVASGRSGAACAQASAADRAASSRRRSSASAAIRRCRRSMPRRGAACRR